MSHETYWLEKWWGEYSKVTRTTKTMVYNDSDDEEDNANQTNKKEETKAD